MRPELSFACRRSSEAKISAGGHAPSRAGARARTGQRLRFVLEEIGCVQWHMLEAPAGIAKRANPSCALKQTFRLLREHTRLAERWAGKACRRGSLRWLLLRASVSCDAQQLIAISHRAPDWTSASLLRPSRLPVATPAASQPPPRAAWGQRSEHAAARAAGNAVSNFLEHASRTKCHEM